MVIQAVLTWLWIESDPTRRQEPLVDMVAEKNATVPKVDLLTFILTTHTWQ